MKINYLAASSELLADPRGSTDHRLGNTELDYAQTVETW
jgi:hypothetical protein